MIEHGKAIKTYLTLMLKDYATARGDNGWAPLDDKLNEVEIHLPLLIQAYEHYQTSSEEFLKLGKPIPKLKDIVEFYSELIILLKEKFTHDSAVLLSGISGGPAVSLMRMDPTFRAPRLLDALDVLLFDSLLSPIEDKEFDAYLSELTKVFEEIPLPAKGYSTFELSEEIIAHNIEKHRSVLHSWFEFLDDYWLARNLK